MSNPGRSLRVAIIGARGIGRHHANWWNIAGADVCAIVGTSKETVAETEEKLACMFGFSGRSYDGVSAMLAGERPDWVDICSPPAVHGGHVRVALEAGAHVLCEKPFLYDRSRGVDTLLGETRELIELARATGRSLALCSQFAVAGAWCRAQLAAQGPVRRLEGELASPAKGRPPDPARVWGDLGPHLLAVAQTLQPDGVLVPESIATDFRERGVHCEFGVRSPAGDALACRLYVHNTDGEPANIRRLAFDGVTFDLEGVRGDDGVFGMRARVSDGRVLDRDDTMRELIRLCAEGNPVLTGEAIYRNEEWLLRLVEAADRSGVAD